MNTSSFMVDHVRLESDKPFEAVTRAFEKPLGRFDPSFCKSLTVGGNTDEA